MGSDSESKNGTGLGEVSPAIKKIIKNLKEIVTNISEAEIYAVLLDCNMDPDDTVQRLLSQDTFHEVKSKRERRKEMKETQDLRPRFAYLGSTRGTRTANERSGWSGSSQANYEEGSVALKGDNVSVAPSSSYLTPNAKGETVNHQPSFNSDSLNTDSRGQSIGTGDGISHTLEPTPAQQPAWSGTSALHLSMADVVRLGRPSSKHSHVPFESTSYTHQDAATTNLDHYYEKPSQASTKTQTELHHDLHPQNSSNVMINNSRTTGSQNAFLEEQSTAPSLLSKLDSSAVPDSDKYFTQSNLYGNESELSRSSGLENILASEEHDADLNSDDIVSANASSRQKDVESSAGVSHSELTEIGSSSKSSSDALADNDVAKFQHLSLGKEDSENNLILPSHLKAFSADCSHLSFGTFKSGKCSSSTGLLPSNELNGDLQEASTMLDGLPAGHLETKNTEYNANDSIGSLYNKHREIADVISCDLQSELTKRDVSRATHGSETEFIYPSLKDYNAIKQSTRGSKSEFIYPSLKDYNAIKQSTPELSLGVNANARNISTMPKSTLDDLVQQLQLLQAPDNLQGQFHATQSLPSRHSNVVPSIGNPNIPFSEYRNPLSNTIPSSVLSSVLPQQRVPNYLPVEQPSNNLMGYSGLPQSYSSHLPSTFRSAYGGGDEFQQSLADLKYSLPDHGASGNRFPAGAPPDAYGAYGVSNNDPGHYIQSSSASPMMANNNYGDVFHPGFKDGNHFTALQQNTSPSTLNYGPGSRMPSAVQESAYYNSSLGQNQQYPGYRRVPQQQPSHQYESLEYSDLYRSQAGMTREHQQRNFGSLSNDTSDLKSEQLKQLYRLQQFWQQNRR
ncbi:hypothetical protein G4B88_007240 [Cannabis sativa]|uniref:GBF-interacting protein 1 N-terminal domain-containing protein n=1 Tax=Cannabis sativa TaxID=3483 RepID=A0A7J6FRN2_CANSA|nr:hypothetical protein G4B88_007240 [Cannabis sativa]